MGRVHIEACAAARGVALTAVVDASAETRRRVAADLDTVVFERTEHLLEAGVVDAVVVAAPSDQHLALVRLLAAASMPTLCEKPCGVRVEHTEAAVAAAAETQTLLQVGYWRRFVPELIELRDEIRRGPPPALVACYQWDRDLPRPEFQAHSGGLAVDMGVHEFDQTMWLTGAGVVDVDASGSAAGVDPPSAAVTLRMTSGTLAFVSLGRPYPGPDSCWVEVIGESGHRRVEIMAGDQADRVFKRGIVTQLEAFAAAAGGGARVSATGEDAIATLRVAERVTDLLQDA